MFRDRALTMAVFLSTRPGLSATDEQMVAGSAPYVQLSDIETAADKANDRRSLNRQLTRKLYLLVKRANSSEWGLPQVAYTPTKDGSLRQVRWKATRQRLAFVTRISFFPGQTYSFFSPGGRTRTQRYT